jgi:lipoprotein-anchoring transpeptidase ErfK/SrfK
MKLIRVVTTAFFAVLSTAGFIAVLSITVGLLIVGENGQAWSGEATVGRKEEWPGWTPTEGEKRRLGPLPNYVEGGAHNPMGARALYLYAGGKDTLYRIHGTNQPGWIGHPISSGCIRLTNEDIIDLYSRVKMGACNSVGTEAECLSSRIGR